MLTVGDAGNQILGSGGLRTSYYEAGKIVQAWTDAAEIAAAQADKSGARFTTPSLTPHAPGTLLWNDCDTGSKGVSLFNDKFAFAFNEPLQVEDFLADMFHTLESCRYKNNAGASTILTDAAFKKLFALWTPESFMSFLTSPAARCTI